MLQSKNNVFQSMVKSTEGKEGIDLSDLRARMSRLNEVFAATIDNSKATEQRITEALRYDINNWLESDKKWQLGQVFRV